MAAESRQAITPETKVGELLAAYPELEEVLVAASPTYQALKNPVLRRTVAKVATLRQVAKVGGVSVGALVGRLRQAAGQEPAEIGPEEPEEGARPAWADPAGAWRTFDARETIEGGGHPMAQVMHDLAEAAPGQVYALVTPFVPAPLIEAVKARGFAAYSVEEAPEVVRTYFTRA